MERDEAQLDVCIVRRDEASDTDAEYWIKVTQAYEKSGTYYLQYREENESHDLLVSLNLNEYFVLAIKVADGEDPGIEEAYSNAQEDQNDAFETIQKFLADEEGFQAAESQASAVARGGLNLVGPKRVEIIVHSTSFPQGREERMVVTSVTPPAARFSTLSVMGRSWFGETPTRPASLQNVSSLIQTYSNLLVQIREFAGGPYGAASIHNIGPSKEQQEQGWALLEKAQSRLTQAEVNVVRRWTPTESSALDLDDTEYGEHWTRYVPTAYQPSKAYFRVSGDEIGATLYRKQQEKMQDEADQPEVTETAKATEAAPSAPEGAATPVDAPFCDCQSPMCDRCLWNSALRMVGSHYPPGIVLH